MEHTCIYAGEQGESMQLLLYAVHNISLLVEGLEFGGVIALHFVSIHVNTMC